MVLTGQKYLCKINWLLFAQIFVPAKKAYCTKLSILKPESTSQQATKPGQDKIFSATVEEEKGRKLFFLQALRKVKSWAEKWGRELAKGGNFGRKMLRICISGEKKSISGGDRWQRPVSFQLFALLSLIADNPPSTSPKFCGHLR